MRKVCEVCGIWIDRHGRCNCNSRGRNIKLSIFGFMLIVKR